MFLGAVLSPPVVLLAYLAVRARRRRAAARLIASELLARLSRRESGGRFATRTLLAGLAMSLIFVALARPLFGTKLEVVTRRGVDVVVAIDTSLSMLTEDVKPNRLGFAKRVVLDLFDRLGADRVGIVAFAGDAFTVCPLTLDQAAARMFLDDIGPYTVSEPGTAIGTAIRKGIRAFGRQRGKHKVLLLLTDGEDHDTDPVGAAKEAKKEGIVIHAIGFGTGEGAPIPLKEEGSVKEYKKSKEGKVVMSRLDEEMLARVAGKTGGRYFRATPGEAEIDRIVSDIEGMEKRELSQKLQVMKEERFQIPLLAAIILLLVEELLRAVPRRRTAALALLSAVLVLSSSSSVQALPLTGAAPIVEKGNRHLEEGKLDQAMAAYAKAKAVLPDSKEITFDVGDVLYKQEKYDEALKQFQEAAGTEDPALRASSFYNAGNSLFRAGKIPEALEMFKKAIVADPEDQAAKWNYELALEKLKEQKKKEDEKQDKDKDKKKDENKGKQRQKAKGSKGEDEKPAKKPEATPSPTPSATPSPTPKATPKAGEDKKEQQQEQNNKKGDAERQMAKQQKGKQGSQAKPMTKKDAEKILDAFLALERETKRRADKEKQQARSALVEKDW